jgi:hypothetical protein
MSHLLKCKRCTEDNIIVADRESNLGYDDPEGYCGPCNNDKLKPYPSQINWLWGLVADRLVHDKKLGRATALSLAAYYMYQWENDIYANGKPLNLGQAILYAGFRHQSKYRLQKDANVYRWSYRNLRNVTINGNSVEAMWGPTSKSEWARYISFKKPEDGYDYNRLRKV